MSTSTAGLVAVHARAQLLETLRVPIAVLGTALFPALSLLFFVVPTAAAGDPVASTAATAQLVVFAVMSACLFTYGVGVAEDRALPWDSYVRTLPVGPLPRLLGRVWVGVVMSAIGLVPVLLLAATATAATTTPLRAVAAAASLLLAGLPFCFGGLAIGYSLTTKAALPVAQVLLFPLAFAGGLFLPPQLFPGWLDALSGWLPSRAGRDLVVAAALGDPGAASPADVLVLLAWTALALALAVRAYRRDEGERFR